jgi:hypothetical protein
MQPVQCAAEESFENGENGWTLSAPTGLVLIGEDSDTLFGEGHILQ